MIPSTTMLTARRARRNMHGVPLSAGPAGRLAAAAAAKAVGLAVHVTPAELELAALGRDEPPALCTPTLLVAAADAPGVESRGSRDPTVFERLRAESASRAALSELAR